MISTKSPQLLSKSRTWSSCHQITMPDFFKVRSAVNSDRFYSVLFPNLKEKKMPLSLRTLSPVLDGVKYGGVTFFNGRKYSSSVRPEEVNKFERMAASWWNQSASGQMKELHSMNKLRVPFIRDGILQDRLHTDRENTLNKPMPLEGYQILDIGCGGGILCEPLGKLGAVVKGIDPGKENITVANAHLPVELRERVSYECISIEDLSSKDDEKCKYDAVVMSEVIEHIETPENFIRTATDVLKPGGSLFLTTLNRTLESWLGAIVAWEYLLRKLPVGTHDWRKFLTPQEVDRIFKSCGLRTVVIHGMCYNPLNSSWKWSNQRAINYAVHAKKIL